MLEAVNKRPDRQSLWRRAGSYAFAGLLGTAIAASITQLTHHDPWNGIRGWVAYSIGCAITYAGLSALSRYLHMRRRGKYGPGRWAGEEPNE